MKVNKKKLLLIAAIAWCIAGFYSGIGASLLMAGILFGIKYCSKKILYEKIQKENHIEDYYIERRLSYDFKRKHGMYGM